MSRTACRRLRRSGYAALLLNIVAGPVQAAGWGGAAGLSTAYLFRGLSLSGNSASLQADVHYRAAAGWFAGAGAASVRLNPYENESLELDAYVGQDWNIDQDWGTRVTAIHYQHPDPGLQGSYNYDELDLTLAWRDAVYVSAAAFPDLSFESTRGYASGRQAFAYDLTLNRPLWNVLSARAGIGYFDVHRLFGVGYLYGNAGVGLDFGDVHFDVDYIFTNATAKGLYQASAGNRWVGALFWYF